MNSGTFNYIFNLGSHPIIADIALFLNKFTYIFLFIILIWVLSFAKHRLFTFVLLFASSLSAWFIAHGLKLLFHMPRPFIELGLTPLAYQGNYSFPSEHSAVFSALAVAMCFVHKRAGIVLAVLAILVGFSRIVLGVHYPIDVLGGFAVGTLVAFLYVKFFKKI